VTRLNAAHIAKAVEWALSRKLPISLNFYRQSPMTLSRADLILEENEIIDGMRQAYAVIERMLPTYPLFHGLVDRVQAAAHTHTCGTGISYLVFTHEGSLAQCHMHLGEASSPSQHTDALQLVAAGPIRNLSVDHKEGCKSCSYRYRCAGGCPIETFRATGRWDVQSPHCNIYKSLIPEALRLEGLRLLKLYGWLDEATHVS